MNLAQWLKNRAATTKSPPHPTLDVLLSLRAPIQSLREQFNPAQEDSLAPGAHIHFLSGPEGGLSAAEEDAALAAGFQPTTLGPRVLRAETAALAVLATLLI